jgi:hypothetical protein
MYEMQGPRWPYGAPACQFPGGQTRQFPGEATLYSRATSDQNLR